MAGILFVCLGNICRSPMAHGMALAKVRARGLHGVHIDSAGTAAHHAGESAHPGTEALLRRYGAAYAHAARQVTAADFERFDHVLALDHSNHRHLERLAPAHLRHRLALALEPVGGGEVPDPWGYGPEAYQRTWDLLEPAVEAWLDRVARPLR